MTSSTDSAHSERKIPPPEYAIEFRLAAGHTEQDAQEVFERVLAERAVNGAALVCMEPHKAGTIDYEEPDPDG